MNDFPQIHFSYLPIHSSDKNNDLFPNPRIEETKLPRIGIKTNENPKRFQRIAAQTLSMFYFLTANPDTVCLYEIFSISLRNKIRNKGVPFQEKRAEMIPSHLMQFVLP